MVHLRLNSQAEVLSDLLNEGALLECLGCPDPQASALGTHRLHDQVMLVFAKLLHKQVILAGHLKGFGKKFALNTSSFPASALQLFPQASLQVLHHVVLWGELGSRLASRSLALVLTALSTSQPQHPTNSALKADPFSARQGEQYRRL